jgi:hypothetical protein
MTHKIILSILLSITIGVSIFTIFQFTFSDSLDTRERIFYEQDFDQTTDKILLLGSSHVGQINATYVNSLILKKIPNSVVYNLAEASNLPSKRLATIDEIIKMKPSIVVYGIGYRDFSDKLDFNQKDVIFPDPEKIIHDSLRSTSINNFDFLDNPKLVTLNTIKGFLKTGLSNSSVEFYKENTPFFPYEEAVVTIVNISEIEKNYDKNSNKIKINLKNNIEINSFKKIIEILQKNNISIILFDTPHQKFYTDLIPDSEKTSFEFILNELSQKYKLNVYSLKNKYSTSNIWATTNHVATNSNSSIYSEDIAKMILEDFN